MRQLKFGLGVLVFVAGIGVTTDAQPSSAYKIIVHPENPTPYMSPDEISDVFLKKALQWEDGSRVEPINLEADSKTRAAFAQDIHGRSVNNVERYWQQQVFSGRGKPPLVVADDAAVMAAVSSDRGAIGYVSASAELAGVRELNIMIMPERVTYVPPQFPVAARRARASGEVILEISIDSEGAVTDVMALKELGFGLTDAAIKAVRNWKYRPAKLDGVPVPTTITVELKFDSSSL